MTRLLAGDSLAFDAALALAAALLQAGATLRANAYSAWRPEALLLLAVVWAAWLVPAVLGRALGVPWLFSVLVLLGLLDATMGLPAWVGAGLESSGLPHRWAWGLSHLTLVAVAATGWALRRALPRLLMVGLAAAVVSGWVVDATAGHQLLTTSSAAPPPRVGTAGAPPVLFLVLDEHQGFATLPPEVRRAHQDFVPELARLRGAGFDVYEHATSNYYWTRDSIPSYVNAEVAARQNAHVEGATLIEDRLFARWRARGYRIHVYQSTWLDYCHTPGVAVDRCVTYESSAGQLQATPVRTLARLRILVAALLDEQHSWLLSRLLGYLPSRRFISGNLGPLAADGVLTAIRADLRQGGPGLFLFAHLLLPHFRYVYDAACGVKSPERWLEHSAAHLPGDRMNDEASRDERYREYALQVVCTQAKLGALWTWMRAHHLWDSALVILAGDHGSRISRWPLHERHRATLRCTDYEAGFQALLAVKRPFARGPGRLITTAVPAVRVIARTLGLGPVRGPDDRVLLETDVPDRMVPVPYQGCPS